MEESVKYFVPEISDIRVGYECECNGSGEWLPISIQVGDFYTLDHTRDLRVPYLTKEQIEAEGWEETKSHGIFKKGDWLVGLLSPMITIRYRTWYPEETKFVGECKDINTFRYITKLLRTQ